MQKKCTFSQKCPHFATFWQFLYQKSPNFSQVWSVDFRGYRYEKGGPLLVLLPLKTVPEGRIS